MIIDVLNVKRMQSVPLNDPEYEPVEAAEGIENRVRALAEHVRRRQAGDAAADPGGLPFETDTDG